MARHWIVKVIGVIASFISALLIGVYREQIRELISTYTGQTDTTVVLYLIWGTVILLVVLGSIYIIWTIYSKYFKINVVIEKDSLSFIKYPYRAGTRGSIQPYTNMAYGDITLHNNTKNRINDCSLEIDLRRNNVSKYKTKVLSSVATPPNPITVSIDGERDASFCPVGLHLQSIQAFLPHDSLGEAGNFTGPLIANGEYEIFGRILIEGKCEKWQSLGIIKIPSDIIEKAEFPNDIQVIIDKGGFAIYAELVQGKVRAKFFGKFTNGDVKRVLASLKGLRLLVDDIVEENGKLRKIDDRPPILPI
jgi:hypothetical protein